MHKRSLTTLFVIALTLFVVSVVAPHKVFAGGGVGSGGSGGGGAAGGPWGWTTYGHGWATYSSSGSGPTAGFNTGNWPFIQSTCQGQSAATVVVYIMGTGAAPPGNSPTGLYMGYSDRGYSGAWGDGGGVDNGRASKISRATAYSYFSNLGSYGVSTAGYTWGSNVGWFCWDFAPPQWYMHADSSVSGALGSGTSINAYQNMPVTFRHTVWNSGPDTTTNIDGGVYWGGSAGMSGSAGPTFNWPFGVGSPWGAGAWNPNIPFTIPPAAVIGSQYCQSAAGHPRAWDSGSWFSSPSWACVTVVPPPQVTPSVTLTPVGGEVEQGQFFTATGKLKNNSSFGPANVANVTWDVWLSQGTAWSPTTTFGSTPGDNRLPASQTFFGGAIGPSATQTVGTASGNAPTDPTLYNFVCARVTAQPGDAYTQIVPSPGITNCIKIVKKPFFTVLNGDINAARSMTGAPNNGTVNAFNQAVAPYNGSKTSIAAFAAGAINYFATNWGSGGSAPAFLTFANSGGAPSPWGGNGANAVLGTIDMTDFTKAASIAAGGVTLGSQNITGPTPTLYVNGNVYVTGNITYQQPFTIDNIPSYKVVATGDIYIAPGVAQLSGVFKAKGTIYTCAQNAPFSGSVAETRACSTQLTVQGALIGKKVELTRTYNTLLQSASIANSAETLIFSPEQWFTALPGGVPGGGGPSGGSPYDSLVSLPPVL